MLETPGIKRAKRYFSEKAAIIDQRILVFGFFLLLSTVFWFLNELNQEASTSLVFPVRYSNLPRDKVLVNELPARLELQVRAPGYTLLRYLLTSRRAPVTLNMESLNIRVIAGTEPPTFYLLTQFTRESLNRQLLSDATITGIKPDTLFFTFDEIARKKVPVEPSLELWFTRQYQLSGPYECEPDSIIVSGPNAIIDTIRAVRTRWQKFDRLSQTMEKSIILEEIPAISFSHKRVLVRIPVEQFTEASLEIPISTENVPDSLSLKLFPQKVTLNYMVSLSNFPRVHPGLFRAEVFYPSQGNILPETLPVELSSIPDYLRSVRLHPARVEYIIEKK